MIPRLARKEARAAKKTRHATKKSRSATARRTNAGGASTVNAPTGYKGFK